MSQNFFTCTRGSCAKKLCVLNAIDLDMVFFNYPPTEYVVVEGTAYFGTDKRACQPSAKSILPFAGLQHLELSYLLLAKRMAHEKLSPQQRIEFTASQK